MNHITLAQFCAWYRLVRPSKRDAERQAPDVVVLIATPSDQPAPPGERTLPVRVKTRQEREVQRLRCPRPLRWTPHNCFSELMLFKVTIVPVQWHISFHLYIPLVLQTVINNILLQSFSTWKELLPYCDQETAKKGTEELDVSGGKNETRIDCVKRLMKKEYVIV